MKALAPLMLLALTECTSFAPRFPSDAGALQGPGVLSWHRAAYTQLTPEWAVTNRHADGLLFAHPVESKNFDLAFFRHAGTPPQWADAEMGEPVKVNGNPFGWADFAVFAVFDIPPIWANREQADGYVVTQAPWYGQAGGYTISGGMTLFIRGASEDGFSGGPIVDPKGRVVGVVWGPIEKLPPGEARYRIGDTAAVPSEVVWSEFRRLVPAEVAAR